LNIHVGVHSNYSHYTDDLSLFEELQGIAQIHLVDEIDWMKHYSDNYRYSKMHCLNLMNLLKNCQYYEFDYAIHLDNDLLIKEDFISSFEIDKYDLIFDYFDNHNIIRKVDNERTDTGFNGKVQFAPKITAWNLIFSRKIYDRILLNFETYFPERISDKERIQYYKTFMPDLEDDRDILFDTFAKLLFYCQYIWNDVSIYSTDGKLNQQIHHFFHSSFNYGVQICNNKEGVMKAVKIWQEDFNCKIR
jgi:hypothetical protein